jgi:hypothetical protein
MIKIYHPEYGELEHRDGQEDLERYLAGGWTLKRPEFEVVKRGPGRPPKDRLDNPL